MSREDMMNKLGLTPADFGEKDLQTEYTEFVEKWLNDTVHSQRDYDNVDTCIGRYYNSPIPKFKAEAHAVNDWVSLVWVECYKILDDVKAGKRPIPTKEELIAELPKLEW